MTFHNNFLKAIAVLSVGAVVVGPMTPSNSAMAQTQASKHRQKTKNDWRNLSIGSGAIAVLGLLKHDNTIAFLGAAGALYSLNRYEQDRKSQSKIDHARYTMFSQGSYNRDGHHYVRKTKWVKGQKYYYFVKTK